MKTTIDKTIEHLEKRINSLLVARRNVIGENDQNPSKNLTINSINQRNEEIRELYLEKNRIRNDYFNIWNKTRKSISSLNIRSSLPQKDQEVFEYKKKSLIKKINQLVDRRYTSEDEEKIHTIDNIRNETHKKSKKTGDDLAKKVNKIYSANFLKRFAISLSIALVMGGAYFSLDYFKFNWHKELPGTTYTETTTTLVKTPTTATTSTTVSPPDATTSTSTSTSGSNITEPVDVPFPGDPGVTTEPMVENPTAITETQTFEYTEVVNETIRETTIDILGMNISVSTLYLAGIIAATVIVFASLTYLYQAVKDHNKAKEVVKEGAVLDILQEKVHKLDKAEDRNLQIGRAHV